MMKEALRAALGLLVVLAAPSRAETPRLAVIVVVDQMRADYLDRFRPNSDGGFGRLLREGAVFTQAKQAHVPTETAPGHADIATGRYPFQHGIVGNSWWDRQTGRQVISVDDPLFGKSPANIMVYALGDVMKARDPESKAAALSWKDRSAIIMGGKRPDVVLWYDQNTGEYTSSSYYGKLPDWVGEFNRQHPVDGHYFKLHPELTRLHGAPLERAPTTYYSEITATPFADQLLESLAERAVDALELGRGSHPDLLAVSFSATDAIGHRDGPDAPAMNEQLKDLDRALGRLFDTLDRRVGRGRYVAVLTADHGVLPIPESPRGKAMGARRVLFDDFVKQVEAALEKRLPLPHGAADQWLLAYQPANVYLNRTLAKTLGIGMDRLLAEATKALKGMDCVAEVFSSTQIAGHRLGENSYAEVFSYSFYPERSGDLMLLMKENVLVAGPTGTSHGLPYGYDARVPLVFMGAGVKPGRYSEAARATDIVPTLARLLGVPYLAGPASRVLEEMLDR